jgi:hypothetical protein
MRDEIKKRLLEVSNDFIESLGVTMSSIGNMMAYTFLIPLLPEIYNLVQGTGNDVDSDMIVKRILNYGLVTVSSLFVKEIITKIVERFKS